MISRTKEIKVIKLNEYCNDTFLIVIKNLSDLTIMCNYSESGKCVHDLAN